MNRIGWIATAVVYGLLCCAAFAQSGSGSIEGVVHDATGAVIPGAQIAAMRVDTNQQFQGVANHSGLYLFPSLQPGQYRLTARAAGMQTWEATVTLRTGQQMEVPVVLSVGVAASEITVSGDLAPMVNSVNSIVGVTVERERIEQLPLNGRNVVSMVQLTAPGLEGSTAELSVYGLRFGALEFVQDGASLSNRVWNYPQQRPPGLDTIEEFKVETNNASARSNRPATAIMKTRGGTNQFHGALFETARNNGLGLARKRQDYYEKAPPMVRNEFGASAGGPVYLPGLYNGKNRTFIFVAYEASIRRQQTTQSTSVWTQAMRDGDFSGLLDGQGRRYTIYDPWTTDSKTWQRTPFPGNRIPVGRRSPLATHLFAITPLPTQTDVNPLVGDNWYGAQPDSLDQHTGTLRLDHRLSGKDQIFVRYTQGATSALLNNGLSGSPITLDSVANIRFPNNYDRSAAVSWTHNVGPTLFSETLVSVARERRYTPVGDESTNWADKLGLPNPFGRPGLPEIGNTGVGMEFRENANTFQDLTRIWNIDQNMTKVAGRHEIQFGVRFRSEGMDNLPQQQYVKGLTYFNSSATSLYDPATGSLLGAVARTGHDSANLFLGVFSSYQVNRTRDWFYCYAREYAGYFQDNWKATSRLSVNVGLRAERAPFVGETRNLITGFDPKSRSVVLGRSLDELYTMGALNAGVVDAYQQLGVRFTTPDKVGLPDKMAQTDAIMFGPRLGFAYRVTTGNRPLILRGGYSRFAFPVQLRAWTATARTNPPLATKYQISLNTAAQSPDGQRNYLLRAVPPYVAGVNTKDLFDPARPAVGDKGSIGGTYFEPDQPSSRSDQWNLTFEKEIIPNTVMRAVLLANRGTHLDQFHDTNEETSSYVWFVKTGLPLPSGDNAGIARRQWDTDPYGTMRAYSKTGWSNFAGFQLEFERRYSKGMGWQLFYVMSNSNAAGGTAWSSDFLQDTRVFLDGAVPQDEHERNRFLNYARQSGVPKHRVRWNWIADLPLGKGKPIARGAGRILNGVIGGWQLAGFGNVQSQWWSLPTSNWGYLGDIETYGTKYPVQDCRSGRCVPGYLYWNGYLPANRINSYDAKGNPNGVMGVPSDYKPSNLPVWTTPADGGNPNDPNYRFLGGNTVFVKLKNGTLQQIAMDNGLHPWRNILRLGPMLWNLDASLFKAVALTERVRLRFNADFFNVLNMPGIGTPGGNGILSTQNSVNSPRQVQLTLRLIW